MQTTTFKKTTKSASGERRAGVVRGSFILVVLLIALMALMGCRKSTEVPARPNAKVVVAVPLTTPIVEWDEFVGRFTAIESVNVRARVSGYLEETRFKEGQQVQAGDVLAVIDRRPFISEVNRNRANLKASEALLTQANAAVSQAISTSKRAEIHRDLTIKELNRQTSLRRQNATSQQEFEVAEAELAQAEADVAVAISGVESAKSAVVGAEAAISVSKANLELAELNLQYTEIRSPIVGRISHRYVTEGNLISGGSNDATLITTIVSMNPIHCYFDADEQTYLKYTRLSSEGKRISSRDARNPVFLAVGDEQVIYPHQGHMDFVENQMDVHTGTIRGRAIVPNDDLKLTPGLFARVRLPGSPRYDAILIPDKGIGTDQAEKFVFIVNQESKIERRVVTLGPLSHGLRIIRKGLNGDERVVIAGQQRARPGAEVSVTEELVTLGPEPLPDHYEPVPEDKWLTPKRRLAGNVDVPVSDSSNPTTPVDGSKDPLLPSTPVLRSAAPVTKDGGES